MPDSAWSPAYIVSIFIIFQYIIDYVLCGSAMGYTFVYVYDIPHMLSVCFLYVLYVFHMFFIYVIYVFSYILVVCRMVYYTMFYYCFDMFL